MQKRDLLYSGKAKSVYETDDPGYVVVEFRDDTTAFDGEKCEQLANKGRLNNQISAHIMQHLNAAGVPTHFVELLSPHEVLVRRLSMIPLESVVRNYAAGSLCRRLGIESRRRLDPVVLEFFLKDDALHDPMVNDYHALAFGWATLEQMTLMRERTVVINTVLSELFGQAGMLLVDAKFEFGIGQDGELYLGDEISPDSCRIWDKDTLDVLDKDRFRQDMGGVMEAYQQVAERLNIAL